ncbi:MAG TPA: ABC transporter permease [Dermatophilaceae bacterium]|nr:ABC transporter permease [Dermatophilaceae bacterium]
MATVTHRSALTQLHLRHRPAPSRQATGPHVGTAALLRDQLTYALRDLWRGRIAFIFTFLFPLTFLLVTGAMAGNETIAPDSEIRISQFFTPLAAVMGALYGAFPTVATSLADARERGMLKRVRGTPLPGWVYLAGRIGAAALMALGAWTLMLLVGVVAYDVQIQWDTMPATVVTVLLAVTAFAAAGVAVAGLARSAALAEAVAIAVAVVLSFLSGIMGIGDLPGWADRIAGVFPIKPFADALSAQFDPLRTGTGWNFGALAVIAAWAGGAGVVAVLTFRWDPAPARRGTGTRGPGVRARAGAAARTSVVAPRAFDAVDAGRPGWLSVMGDQARWATSAALRDLGWVFFAIAMPVAVFVFNASVMPGDLLQDLTPPLMLQMASGMAAWAAAITGMVNVPEAVARARDKGILKRLRGTPVPLTAYLVGRLVSALGMVLVTGGLVLGVGVVWFTVEVAWRGLPLAVAMLVLGTVSLTACGMLLAAVLPSVKAMSAVGLGIALPLSFFSDVFAIGFVPEWMSTVGSFFPLKHLANSVSFALDPAGPTVSWLGIAVMTAWLVGAGLLAVRLFRWSPDR